MVAGHSERPLLKRSSAQRHTRTAFSYHSLVSWQAPAFRANRFCQPHILLPTASTFASIMPCTCSASYSCSVGDPRHFESPSHPLQVRDNGISPKQSKNARQSRQNSRSYEVSEKQLVRALGKPGVEGEALKDDIRRVQDMERTNSRSERMISSCP